MPHRYDPLASLLGDDDDGMEFLRDDFLVRDLEGPEDFMQNIRSAGRADGKASGRGLTLSTANASSDLAPTGQAPPPQEAPPPEEEAPPPEEPYVQGSGRGATVAPGTPGIPLEEVRRDDRGNVIATRDPRTGEWVENTAVIEEQRARGWDPTTNRYIMGGTVVVDDTGRRPGQASVNLMSARGATHQGDGTQMTEAQRQAASRQTVAARQEYERNREVRLGGIGGDIATALFGEDTNRQMARGYQQGGVLGAAGALVNNASGGGARGGAAGSAGVGPSLLQGLMQALGGGNALGPLGSLLGAAFGGTATGTGPLPGVLGQAAQMLFGRNGLPPYDGSLGRELDYLRLAGTTEDVGRRVAQDVLGMTNPQLEHIRAMLEQRRNQLQATMEHRGIVAREDFEREMRTMMQTILGRIDRIERVAYTQGPVRY